MTPDDPSGAAGQLSAGAPDPGPAKRHGGAVIWLTGLPAAGKTTLARAAHLALGALGYRAYVLDGDEMRRHLCADLGFSPEDRNENIRRAGAVAALMADAGLVCLAAFISPYAAGRETARAMAGKGFREIYVKADDATRRARDPKGHYAKADAGELPDFTGVSAPYEIPDAPDLIIDTASEPLDRSLATLVGFIARECPLTGVNPGRENQP